jgi:hypothetical protein
MRAFCSDPSGYHQEIAGAMARLIAGDPLDDQVAAPRERTIGALDALEDEVLKKVEEGDDQVLSDSFEPFRLISDLETASKRRMAPG